MRALLCSIVVLGLAVPARAGVGVLPVVAVDLGPDGKSKSSQLESAVKNILGKRYEQLPECKSSPTDFTSECAKNAPKKNDVEEVAQITVRRHADGYAVRLVVRDGTEGAPLFTDEVAPADERAVRALMSRAFAPSQYGGKLRVTGAPRGSVVIVDGLPTAGDTSFVRVGHHVVEVLEPDGFVHRLTTEVKFEETEELAVPARAVAAPIVVRSNVPFVTAVSIGAAGLVMFGLGVGLYFGIYAPSAQQALEDFHDDADGVLPPVQQDPTGAGWNGELYGATKNSDDQQINEAGLRIAVMATRQRQRSESIIASRGFLGLATGGGIIAAGAGGAAVLMLISGDVE
jgi:hypothetical protein